MSRDTVWVTLEDGIPRELTRDEYEQWARARAAELIELREQGWTYDRIADCVGLTRERVRQIVVREERRKYRHFDSAGRLLYIGVPINGTEI